MRVATFPRETYPLPSLDETISAIARPTRRAIRIGMAGGLLMLALVTAGCRRNDGGFFWPNPAPDPPEQISYTVAQFVEERNNDKCPSDKRLKFEEIELTSSDTVGTYTMKQDGAASPETTVTIEEEPLSAEEVATIDTVIADVTAGCGLKVITAMG